MSAETVSLFCGNFPTFVDVSGNGFVILRELISVGIVRVHTEVVHLLIGPSVQALEKRRPMREQLRFGGNMLIFYF